MVHFVLKDMLPRCYSVVCPCSFGAPSPGCGNHDFLTGSPCDFEPKVHPSNENMHSILDVATFGDGQAVCMVVCGCFGDGLLMVEDCGLFLVVNEVSRSEVFLCVWCFVLCLPKRFDFLFSPDTFLSRS